MLTMEKIYNLQQKHNLKIDTGNKEKSYISLADYYKELKRALSNRKQKNFADATPEERQAATDRDIELFVEQHKQKIQGYVNDLGEMDYAKLLKDCKNYIYGAGILAEALDNPDVDEIQINDMNTIFVIINGKAVPYVDNTGKPYRFNSDDEIIETVNKLIDDGTGNATQLNEGSPLLNAKTAKHQYRVSATHAIANARGLAPYNFPVTTVTIRKFKKVKLTLDNLVNFKTLTQDMAELTMLIGRTSSNLCFVGITGSGKTTLMNIVAQAIPTDKRIICTQNPTEITFPERDEYGRNKRNVTHWEASDSADAKMTTSNTVRNLINHNLRNTPDVSLIGEARSDEEFEEIIRMQKTGQQTLMTCHAAGYKGAVPRIAGAITKGDDLRATKDVAEHIGIVYAQHRYPDGSRRVTAICEVLGVDERGEPKYNLLYEYVEDESTEEQVIDEYGNTHTEVKLHGHFVQRNPISDNLHKAFKASGVLPREYAKFLKVSDEKTYI